MRVHKNIFRRILAVSLAAVMVVPNSGNVVFALTDWPTEFNNIPGPSPYTREGYWSYPWENNIISSIQNVTDENNQDTLFCVPVTFVDFKSETEIANGTITAAQNGQQFASVNKSIQEYHNSMVGTPDSGYEDVSAYNSRAALSTFKYPLYFGSFSTTDDILNTLNNNENNTYVFDSKDKANRSAYYFLNNNFNGTSYACLNIVGEKLDENGRLLSRDGAVMPYFDVDGTNADGSVHSGWASQNSDIATVYGVGSGNALGFPFKERDDGWYEFDSTNGNQNIQVYKDSDNKDCLTYSSSASKAVNDYVSLSTARKPGFFPFNTDVEAANNDVSDGKNKLNYGFSMRMDIPFTIPDTSEEVKFEFSGDDDVWVFVDGVLALDLGGMHAKAEGVIDFTNKTTSVTTGAYDIGNDGYRDAGTLFGTYWTSETLFNESGLFNLETGSAIARGTENSTSDLQFDESKTTHTLTVFYMERGMYESNLKVAFNFVPAEQSNGISVKNTVNTDSVNTGFKTTLNSIINELSFDYYVKNTDTTKTSITENDHFTITGHSGVFHHIDTVEVEEGSDPVSIRGDSFELIQNTNDSRFYTSYAISDINGTTIKEKTSGYKAEDGRNGEGTILLQNQPPEEDDTKNVGIVVDYENEVKTSSAIISKNLVDGFSSDDTEYSFKVEYTNLFGTTRSGVFSNGTYAIGTQIKTSSADGIIRLKAGETATISGIPVDTVITVTEMDSDNILKNVQLTDDNMIKNVSNGAAATVEEGDIPSYEFTNSIETTDRLVYYTQVGKKTELPLPDSVLSKTVVIAAEKKVSDAIGLNENAYEKKAVTFNDVTAGTHSLTFESSSGPSIIFVGVEIEGTEYFFDTASDEDIIGKVLWFNMGNGSATISGGIKDYPIYGDENSHVPIQCLGDTEAASVTIPVNITNSGTVTVNLLYKSWVSDYSFNMYLDKGVSDTGGTAVLNPTQMISVQKADSTGATTAEYTLSAKSINYTSSHVGADKYILQLDSVEGSSFITTSYVDVVVYNFNVNDHIYVLDYGLPVNLAGGENGFDSMSGDSASGFAITNDIIEAEDIADYDVTNTKLGFTDEKPDFKDDTDAAAYDASAFVAKNEEMTGKQGTLKYNSESSVIYTPNKFMNDIDTFYYGIQVTKVNSTASDATNATPVMVGEVKVMPADVVYYEDNFAKTDTDEVDGTNGIIYSGEIENVDNNGNPLTNVSSDLYQSNSIQMEYGHDDAYIGGDDLFSGGSAHKMGNLSTAAFKFSGSGFDIISRASSATGIIGVIVYEDTGTGEITNNGNVLQVNNANSVKNMMINTYYVNGDVYQIPVISWKNDTGEKKNYIVKIVSYASGSTRQQIYIDGIRIYNPLKGDSAAESQYDKNGELNADIMEVRQLILGEDFIMNYENPLESTLGKEPKASLIQFVNDSSNEALFLAGKTVVEALVPKKDNTGEYEENTSPEIVGSLLKYVVNGPNNELYLSDGYGFGFGLEALADAQMTLQIGVKKVSDGNSSVTLQYLSSEKQWKTFTTITSATEIYYSIKDLDFYQYNGKKCVVLKAVGGTLSFTNLKMKGCVIDKLDSGLFMNATQNSSITIDNIKVLSGLDSQTQIFRVGDYARITFTTGNDVKEISIGITDSDNFLGKFDHEMAILTTKKANDDKIEWTIKMYIPDNSEFAGKTFYAVAYNDAGDYSKLFAMNNGGTN